jgi:hypothetical protein
MGVLSQENAVQALDMKTWLPFATWTDSQAMADAALSAKTLVAEARGAWRASSSRRRGGAADRGAFSETRP